MKNKSNCKCHSFKKLYESQQEYQHEVLRMRGAEMPLPGDNIGWFSYHIQAMVEELGEVMKADKRWKTHRNGRYEKKEKLDELADVFITAMNITMYSGFTEEQIYEAILSKIEENLEKINKENKGE